MEEKSKKYQHLPVYDKDLEQKKSQDRQEKMNKILSDVDKQLETVSDLTSAHIQEKSQETHSDDSHRYQDQTRGNTDKTFSLPAYKQHSDKSYQSLEKTFSDLQGNNDIPFVDEGDDEDTMIRRVSVSDGRKLIFGFLQLLINLLILLLQVIAHFYFALSKISSKLRIVKTEQLK